MYAVTRQLLERYGASGGRSSIDLPHVVFWQIRAGGSGGFRRPFRPEAGSGSGAVTGSGQRFSHSRANSPRSAFHDGSARQRRSSTAPRAPVASPRAQDQGIWALGEQVALAV